MDDDRSDLPAAADAVSRLAVYFHRNGYVRTQDAVRVADDGFAKYKKGDEVRVVADSERELREIRRLLRAAGFRPGRPFAKGLQFRQPIYGREAVARFLEMMDGR
jgi:hypothetical protein